MNAYITYGSSGGPLYHQRKIVGVNTLKYNNNNMSIHFSKINEFFIFNKYRKSWLLLFIKWTKFYNFY